ncbi:MAG: winged helix DNA-binding domain-containing protein [Armatimonadetes bacterium]|nr:winged helix DNA-binding domain-containing protein [Armatimonadota bacterium]
MDRLRAFWWARQGLDGSLKGCSGREALLRAGWQRTVGSTTPYVALFARTSMEPPEVDAELASLDFHELPSARGCTYLVPREQYATALLCAQAGASTQERKIAAKLGWSDRQHEELRQAVVKCLVDKTLNPAEMKPLLGDAVVSFGEEGKKKGLSTSLPMVLGELQRDGAIRRVPSNGRLDNERYAYTLWDSNPLATDRRSPREAQAELARLYFEWAGPATLEHFRWFSGLGVKSASEAVQHLELEPVEPDSPFLIPSSVRNIWDEVRIPKKPQYCLLGSIDSLVLLRRDIPNLIAEIHRRCLVQGEKDFYEVAGLSDLTSHMIVDRGQIVGLWEFDPENQEIVWMSFEPLSDSITEEIARTQDLIIKHLGDMRSFSLDSPKSRKPRIDFLRKSRDNSHA